ncbi:MAG: ABC transporter permease subunit, partial [Cyclobacteriaceae bacterium]|nr:ABC transporter permease subunit [Cyclobacteriaceae bacterium]
MIQIFKKEFNSFLNSLIAYVVIATFLSSIGLMMWVFPETSVLDYGYSEMDTLFTVGPYMLIFLVPAITMRSFAEEKKMGTLEFLLTKPLHDMDVILGKFFAGFVLVMVSIIPTIVYYYSIFLLGEPQGNVDAAGVIGSYIGLVLLGGIFCTLGILASSLSPNQIVSFIIGALLCLLFYSGFDTLSTLVTSGTLALNIKQLG